MLVLSVSGYEAVWFYAFAAFGLNGSLTEDVTLKTWKKEGTVAFSALTSHPPTPNLKLCSELLHYYSTLTSDLAWTKLFFAQHWALYKADTTRPLPVMVLEFPLKGV